MCTPWTITKLVKKDCASCFLACRFPLDDEAVDDRGRYATTTPPQLPITNMAFDYQRDSGGNEGIRNKNMSPSRHKSSYPSARRRLNHDPTQVREITSTSTSISSSASRRVRYKSSSEESSCRQPPHFADDDQDYIVFCFKEDGAFEVTKNFKPKGQNSMDSTSSSKNSRQINRKNEDEEGKNIRLHTKATPPSSMGEVSEESSDSNQSAHSTASFAFPLLDMEWSGSPVHMPKPEGLDLRKHKARCIGLHFPCCRF
ncbi:protein BREAKING OF ASYMMETRY IN THE STOMATAL LINEAGE [Argentina anserina]|uniref:protein BREAKING OF ASYMMETRY IN THE STOMATAL LINEAGE n=1 Tax=Argentina anserina TaxID=57926 RepID=UPI00217633FE|nr:protein BREAKING OF ASYMMETRY IN THE STOMATAL LINEAGE [Potentilla anserina]